MRKKFYIIVAFLLFISGVLAGVVSNKLSIPTPAFAVHKVPQSGAYIRWEKVDSNLSYKIFRAPVPGGWLILFDGTSFVPDPKHTWR